MKLIILTLAVTFFLNGCYTVLWHPGKELSSIDYYDNYNDCINCFYPPIYFDFYYQPWWQEVNLPKYDRTKEREKLRETAGDRTPEPRPGTPAPLPQRPIPPPTISEPSTGSTNTGSASTSDEETKRTKSSSENDKKDLRNTDGNRSTEPRRK